MRLTHWGIVGAVLLNGLITEGSDQIQVWIGYTALAMLALRLVWGLVGTGPARFSAFPPSLSAARAHIAAMRADRHPAYRSHNPLGALMAYVLWGTLAVVAATGIAMAGSPFSTGPAGEAVEEHAVGAGEHGEETEAHESEAGEAHEGGDSEAGEALEEVHEVAADPLLVLAALHVGGVAPESRLSGRSLVRPMVKGS